MHPFLCQILILEASWSLISNISPEIIMPGLFQHKNTYKKITHTHQKLNVLTTDS